MTGFITRFQRFITLLVGIIAGLQGIVALLAGTISCLEGIVALFYPVVFPASMIALINVEIQISLSCNFITDNNTKTLSQGPWTQLAASASKVLKSSSIAFTVAGSIHAPRSAILMVLNVLTRKKIEKRQLRRLTIGQRVERIL